MKFLLSNLLLLFLTISLSAQSYEISQYRARFERRPFLELNPRFGFSSTFTNSEVNQDRYQGNASISAFWSEQSNLDHRIRSWSAGGNAGFGLQEYESEGFPDRSNAGITLNGSLDLYNYRDDNRFWGYRGAAFLTARANKEREDPADRQTQVSLNPGIFIGTGRIEFSEDALLANWMMDDLLEAGVITSATPEQRLALAQRVTSIIGNRTFDLRRRRIYELKQLNLLFEEANIAVADDFLLFAILNDNWAFANRATLPHGRRWQFGVDGGGNYIFQSQPVSNDQFILSARPYINFQHAQVRHNNAATIWEAELSGFLQEGLDEDISLIPILGFRSNAGVALGLSHTYVWLPISRTTLRWRNAVNVLFEDFEEGGLVTTLNQWNIQAGSTLEWNYFITYNWRLTLNAGLQYSFADTDSFRFRSLRPSLGIQSNYAIF